MRALVIDLSGPAEMFRRWKAMGKPMPPCEKTTAGDASHAFGPSSSPETAKCRYCDWVPLATPDKRGEG